MREAFACTPAGRPLHENNSRATGNVDVTKESERHYSEIMADSHFPEKNCYTPLLKTIVHVRLLSPHIYPTPQSEVGQQRTCSAIKQTDNTVY